MFKTERTARGDRLESDAVLTPSDFASIAKQLGQTPVRARKIGYVAARRAEEREVVETYWNGKESTNTAHAGDFIVTNLSPQWQPLHDDDGQINVYVIAADKFLSLYEPAEGKSKLGKIYRAKGVVSAIALPGGLDIAASWGERQTASTGYLLCNGTEVYGIAKEAFEQTYAMVEEGG